MVKLPGGEERGDTIKTLKYASFVLIAAFIFGCQPVVTKMIYSLGGNPLNVLVFESAAALPFLFTLARTSGTSLRISRSTLGKLVVLGVVGNAGTTLLLGLTYVHLSAGTTTVLHYTYPISTALILMLVFRERLRGNQVLAMLLTVGGAAAISMEGSLSGEPLWIGMAILSGIFWAFYLVYLDKSGLSKEDSRMVNFYSNLFAASCYVILGILTGNLKLLSSATAWVLVIIAGIMSRALAGIVLQKGIRGLGPISTCVLSTFEPLTSLFMGVLILHEALTMQHGFGAALILIGSVWIVAAGAREEKAAQAVPQSQKT